MKKIQLITDTGCDLPLSYLQENGIDYGCLQIQKGEKVFLDNFGQSISHDELYEALRNGEDIKTSLVNSFDFERLFEKHIQQDKTILYIGISSALSGTFHSACMAKDALLEKYPEAKIILIDSKSVSIGEGALVYYACEKLKKGETLEEVVKWLNEHCTKMIHIITVDTLTYLQRGGRVSKAQAAVGSLLQIKPILTLNEEGKIIAIGKVKGRKKSIREMVSFVLQRATNLENQTLFISHADCEEEANNLKQMLIEETKVEDIQIAPIGSIVGVHGGPGAIAVMFLGESREK